MKWEIRPELQKQTRSPSARGESGLRRSATPGSHVLICAGCEMATTTYVSCGLLCLSLSPSPTFINPVFVQESLES